MSLNLQSSFASATPMESSLRKATDWLGCFNERLLDPIPDAVYLFDLVDQRNVFATRSIADLLGYFEAELETMQHPMQNSKQSIGLAHLIHPEDLEAVADHFQSFTVLPVGKVSEIVYRMKRADGQWAWLRSRETSFIQAIDGYPLQVLSTVQDITHNAQNQFFWDSLSSELSATEADRTEQTVMITDRQGVIQCVNQKFEHLTGYTRAEVVGQTPSLLKSGQHQPEFYRHLWSQIEFGQVFRGAFINRKKSGELFHIDQTIVPIKDGQGNITHFLAVGQDVTDYWRV